MTSAAEQTAEHKTVLIVSQSGDIINILEAPDALRESNGTPPATIDALWSLETADSIRAAVTRTLRSRQCQTQALHNPLDGRDYEFIFVAQGPDRVLLIARDQSETQQALIRVREIAYTDETTGLPNREYLFAELQKISDMQRLKEGRAAVICLQVGHFDDQGYALNSAQQDEVLKQLACRLTTHLRGSNEEDVADYERFSIAARTDYRRFCVVLPSIESGEDAEAVVKRLIGDLEQPVSLASRTITVSAAGGISLFPQDGMDAASLFENATVAMEDARNDPAAPFKFHSGTVRLRTLQRQDLEVELRLALDQEQYALNFLPIVAADSAAPAVMEALLRWPDTVLGTQSPRKIVRVAERTGLILAIGEWVLRTACEQLQAWHQSGHKDLRVAINLSAQELVSDGIVERIAGLLEKTGTRPQDVDLEIKEHMLFREALRDYAVCRELSELGMRIVVDDFGIGACSLAHLSQSPIGAIKIDNTFVTNLADSDCDRAACAAAIAVAKELGIDVIAEGVETEQQAQILRELGCRYLQGFLFSQPLSEDLVAGYLQGSAERNSESGASR